MIVVSKLQLEITKDGLDIIAKPDFLSIGDHVQIRYKVDYKLNRISMVKWDIIYNELIHKYGEPEKDGNLRTWYIRTPDRIRIYRKCQYIKKNLSLKIQKCLNILIKG